MSNRTEYRIEKGDDGFWHVIELNITEIALTTKFHSRTDARAFCASLRNSKVVTLTVTTSEMT